MMRPNFIILQGQGINCENETLFAIEQAGGTGQTLHLQNLMDRPEILKNAQGLILPGGFSFGDDLGSGLILSESLKFFLKEQLQNLIESKKPILGICNGFQAMVKMNLFSESLKSSSLIANDTGHFQDRWVEMQVSTSTESPWWSHLRGQKISWPIRHGEGRWITEQSDFGDSGVCLKYTSDVNGSFLNAAGLQSTDGLIVGMMPHPEAALKKNQAPWEINKGNETYDSGYYFFKGIVDYYQS